MEVRKNGGKEEGREGWEERDKGGMITKKSLRMNERLRLGKKGGKEGREGGGEGWRRGRREREERDGGEEGDGWRI